MPAPATNCGDGGDAVILHFDLDAFYAAVAARDDPSLRGVPLAIAGRGRRSVVLTASYEARPFGVRSALPLYKALAACPQLVVVPPDFAKYKAAAEAAQTTLPGRRSSTGKAAARPRMPRAGVRSSST